MRVLSEHKTPKATLPASRLAALCVGLAGCLVIAVMAVLLLGRQSSAEASPAAPTALAAEAMPVDLQDDAPEDPAVVHKARLLEFAERVAAYRAFERKFRPRPVVARRGSAGSGGGVRYVARIEPGKTPLECLTQAVYYEARGESREGQVAVAQVVMNRAALPQYPKSVCGVVFQGASRPGCQFSFACEGGRQAGSVNMAAWARAQEVAQGVLDGRDKGDQSATHYHTHAVAPLWDRSMAKLAEIGHHMFFSSKTWTPPASQAEPAALAPAQPARTASLTAE